MSPNADVLVTIERTGEPDLVCEVVGDGPPLLLLHGAASSRQVWRHAGYVDKLKSDYRLLLMDFRGHGDSGSPEDPESYGAMHDIRDVAAVLHTLTNEPTTICGWSWGGMIGLALAALDPQLVRAVVPVGASVGGVGFDDCPRPVWMDEMASDAKRYELEGIEWNAKGFAENGGPPWLTEIARRNSPLALAAWCRGVANQGTLGARLCDIRQPIAYVMGELEIQLPELPDPIQPPHATLKVIKGGTHVTAPMDMNAVVDSITSLVPPE